MFRLKWSVPLVLVLGFAACGGQRPAPGPGHLPLTFVENRGQTDAQARFVVQGPGHAFFLTPGEIALALERPTGEGVALKLRFDGANRDVRPAGRDLAPGITNYLRPDDTRTDVPSYKEVAYPELWPHTELALRGSGETLKYEFRLQPGADPGAIRLTYAGADGLSVAGDGALRIETAIGTLEDAPPVAFQGGKRVPARYSVDGASYGFELGAYDRTQPLVIDPGLAYSTLIGGSAHDMPAAIATDAAGNAYVTGFTQSPDFPTTAGAYDRTGAAGNNLDVFVTKLNPSGTAAVYSTFIGGTNFDWGRAIAVDAQGNAYIGGQTKSSNFPTTPNAFDRSFNVDNCPRCGIDQYDAFVTKLNAAGNALVYSTFLGSFDIDDILAIALDGDRNAYVAGQTGSSNFPVTAGAFDTTANGSFDAFVTKLNASGSGLIYSTRLGGEDNELPEGIHVDAQGNAYVGGSTRSSAFPTTPGAYDTTQNGGAFDERFDLFATKLNPAGNGLVYSTFAGGSKSDFGSDFAVDGAGNAYLVGSTLSPDFPGVSGGSFALKLDPAGGSLVYSRAVDGAGAVAPVGDGSVWLAGGRGGDAWIGRLDATGTTISDEQTLGGASGDGASEIALDPAGNVYITGGTFSPDFPTTPGAFDRTWAGDPLIFWGDGFVAKFGGTTTAPPTATATQTATATATATVTQTPTGPLPAPQLVAPAADARFNRGATVTFDWGDVAGATGYTLQIDDSQSFSAPLTREVTTTTSTATVSGLPTNRMWWRVRANPGGTFSSARRFELKN